MSKELEAVRQVREWRRQVAADWEGKSFQEIVAELEEVRARYEARKAAYHARRKAEEQAS
ncbi:MAG: hypothetical protein HY319_10390 [Armatimonadetes bacterium]|nr:hypothetical protein [Armatimonadota bacterium]